MLFIINWKFFNSLASIATCHGCEVLVVIEYTGLSDNYLAGLMSSVMVCDDIGVPSSVSV